MLWHVWVVHHRQLVSLEFWRFFQTLAFLGNTPVGFRMCFLL